MTGIPRFLAPLPIARQLAGYDGGVFRKDLLAGVTVGVILIPQGMAYALVAGLPPIYGLYTSLVPLVVYAFLGTSRQLAVGPTALASLLTASAVAPIAGGDAAKFVALAILLAFMAGIVQIVLGLVRAGFLANFLSRPVLAGFTSAAAVIIGLGQIKHLLGISIPRSDHATEIAASVFVRLGESHLPTLAIGIGALLIMIAFRQWKKTFPAALVALVAGTAITAILHLDGQGVAIVGMVPSGLPAPQIPRASVAEIRALLPGMFTILAIGIIETIAVAKYYASRNGYEIDADKELIALGAAKILGAVFQAYPNTGGFSRTAVNADAGARTQIATLIAATVVALALLFLTPLFFFIPKAVLGAIIILAVWSLFDFHEVAYLWKVDRKDFALMAITFFSTALLGIETGILVGIVSSLAVVLHSSSRPHTAVMGRLPGTDTWRNVDRYPDAITEPGVVVLRLDASLYFANAGYFKSTVSRVVRENPGIKVLVLDLYPVNRIDSSALHALQEQVGMLREEGVSVLFAGAKGPIRDRILRAGIVAKFGADAFFHEVSDASKEAVVRIGVVDH
ncbi:MAG: solute carrier family 26 protein [Bacteroidetes bacterium]|nr:solute carrier family 26 protein [Bacteroidota bacterium]